MALKRFSDDDRSADFTWTDEDKAEAVLRSIYVWRLSAVVPERAHRTPGRPKEYPVSIFMLYVLLAGTFGSHRAAISWMTRRKVWRKIRKTWAKRGIALPVMPPSRGQCNYGRDAYLAANYLAILQAFEEVALEAARSHGLLQHPHAHMADPPRSCVVSGDATVPRLPINRAALEARRARGERLDGDLYREAGGKPIFGTKFYLQSVRDTDENGESLLHSRVILSVAHVRKTAAGGEAAVALEKLLDLKAKAPGMLGVRYDGAFRGKHIDALMKAGLSVVVPTHDGISRKAIGEVICKANAPGTNGECGISHQLYTEDGWVGVLGVVVDKRPRWEFERLPRKQVLARANKADVRWYLEVELPCGHPHRIRLTSDADDEGRRYNRAEHIRMHPRGSEVYDRSYGWRNDTESTHNQIDSNLYRQRMIAHTVERQALVMVGFAVMHNAVSDWYSRRRKQSSVRAA